MISCYAGLSISQNVTSPLGNACAKNMSIFTDRAGKHRGPSTGFASERLWCHRVQGYTIASRDLLLLIPSALIAQESDDTRERRATNLRRDPPSISHDLN